MRHPNNLLEALRELAEPMHVRSLSHRVRLACVVRDAHRHAGGTWEELAQLAESCGLDRAELDNLLYLADESFA